VQIKTRTLVAQATVEYLNISQSFLCADSGRHTRASVNRAL
jgi:hypothetical protein